MVGMPNIVALVETQAQRVVAPVQGFDHATQIGCFERVR